MKNIIFTEKKYRLTFGNIVSLLSIVISIYNFIYPGTEGWGWLIGINLCFYAISILCVDFIFQKLFHNYIIINSIEILAIIIIYKLNYFPII